MKSKKIYKIDQHNKYWDSFNMLQLISIVEARYNIRFEPFLINQLKEPKHLKIALAKHHIIVTDKEFNKILDKI